VLGEGLENLLALGFIGLIAGGTEAGGGGLGDAFEQVIGGGEEGDEVVADDAPDAVSGAEELIDEAGFFHFLDDADEGLVDDGSGAAGLADDCVAF